MLPQQNPKPQLPQTRYLSVWWFVLIGLLLWNIAHLSPKPRAEVSIPYTTVLDQVRANNVATVQIKGDKITGSFVKPLVWPETKPAVTPPSPAKTEAENPPSAAPNTYAQFDTTFPTAIGDASLLSLLETHKVVVNVRPPSSPWLLELLGNWFPTLLLIGFFGG